MSTARLEALSDGIFAIAATLLVLDLRMPAQQGVVSAVSEQWPALVAFVSTFALIGVAWVHHHNLFHVVRRVDRTMLLLNLGLLLSVTFLPVPTATLGDHLSGPSATQAAVLYGGSMAFTGIWFVLLWNHMYHHPDLIHPPARQLVARARRRSVFGPLSYGGAAALAFVNPLLTVVAIGTIIVYYLVGRSTPTSRTHWHVR